MKLLPETCLAGPVQFEVRLANRRPTIDELLDDLKRAYRKGRLGPLTQDAYAERGSFSVNSIAHHFGSWNAALKAADIPINIVPTKTDEDLFENLADVWRKLGRQPIGRDILRRGGLSQFSLGAYEFRFGTWNRALVAFADFIKLKGRGGARVPSKAAKPKTAKRRRAPRQINWRLRATVLIRDSCLCRMCGASPAKDPAVTLHVDHIVPWSKGGPTTLLNLQTLCSACNIGKSNRLSWPPKATPHPCKPTRSQTSKRSGTRRRR
ncbi:MAG: HNH endonuclease [Alphaproteobacteria bacterium]|nr:HNH endonuclease [Alphaproteobacteria bacterium]